ncbi:GAF and ANTAR domain-containing protein [Streptomyces sp. NA02950]|uniref:GAF and ANTAR domain-containing protein n=1 Tax=Streptomyces sp. NA02950 TaxID=2742137 RepID=UPI001592223A|nr:GAF and ANTAR domain-containing protein [Streptomyces sp. NA02950]QKV90853.1 GAF and ANTAR domain-containing protein [Streptomyces sp. NA02950]
MGEQRSWEELAVAVAEMSRTLLAQSSVQSTLDEIVRHAVNLVEGCENAGVLVLENRERVRTLAASSDLVHSSDQAQQDAGEGPCFDAARTLQEAYRIEDLTRDEPRWPRYAPRARELGIGSMMGFLLFTEEGTLGALDLYSSRPGVFTTRCENTGWILASHAAVALSSARSTAQLHTAMETRNEIGEALGIVMERFKVSEDQAFEVLKKSSQDQNIKLREVARLIVTTGRIPGAR